MGNKAKRARAIVAGVIAATMPDATAIVPTIDNGTAIVPLLDNDAVNVTKGNDVMLTVETPRIQVSAALQRYRNAMAVCDEQGAPIAISNKRAFIVALYIIVCKYMDVAIAAHDKRALKLTSKLAACVPYISRKGHGALDECKGELTAQGNMRYADFCAQSKSAHLFDPMNAAYTKATGTKAHEHIAKLTYDAFSAIECASMGINTKVMPDKPQA